MFYNSLQHELMFACCLQAQLQSQLLMLQANMLTGGILGSGIQASLQDVVLQSHMLANISQQQQLQQQQQQQQIEQTQQTHNATGMLHIITEM